jgi:tRNA pseudouridine55 synthase
LLLVDKPSGPTAHDVVAHVRRTLEVRRAGHSGTLDPFASGLLVIMLGRATRLSQFVVGVRKTYVGQIALGATTETGDPTGAVVETSDKWQSLTDDEIVAAMDGLTGSLQQTPPNYSAKKVGGQRAYRLARRGEEVDLPPCEVEVYRFQLTDRVGARVEFECEVSSGTYVRALARDLGTTLQCGAHLSELRRTVVGPFSLDDAVPLDELVSDATLKPPLEAVAHLTSIALEPEQAERVSHGQAISGPAEIAGPVALLDQGGLLAIAELSGGLLKPKVVLTG